MQIIKNISTFLIILFISHAISFAQTDLVKEINNKIEVLNSLIQKANSKNIDTEREVCVIWMSKEFAKYADWDEKNIENNIK